MAERVVKVRLSAVVNEFKQGMIEAANATRAVGTEAERLAQTRQSMQTLGTAGFAMGAALAAGIGVAVAKFADFDQAMSFVAATGDDARNSMDSLREAALDAGASTVFTATEAANAIEEMAKAGLSAAEILGGGLNGALDLAAAGGLEVADAAGIAATALKLFNLEGSDMSHVADLLAAGAGKAMGDVTDLSAALSQGGQVAAATGLTIEETTATLAAFAAQGLLGSDAGTSFKTMLQRLTPQSNEAKAKMEELGVSAYNAAGNFVGMEKFAGNLQEALADLTPEQRNSALATMFGSDAVRAANVIYKEGADGVRGWIAAVDDQGYAAETAATRLDNLMGDWEALTGALDSAFISMGEGADGPLRALVQGLTDLVDGFNDLPDWVKQSVLAFAGLAAGIGIVGGAALLAVPKIIEMKIALATLTGAGGAARSGLGRMVSFLGGPWGIAMLAAAAAIATFNKVIDDGVPSQAEITNALKTSESAAEGFKTAFARGGVETFLQGDYAEELKDLPGLLDQAIAANENWVAGLRTTGSELGAYDSISRYGDALAELSSSDLPTAQAAFRGLRDEYKLSEEQTRQLLEEMPAYRDALLKVADTQDITKDSAEFLQLAMGTLPDSTAEVEAAMAEMQAESEAASGALDAVSAALDGIAGSAMSMAEAKDAALSAINSLAEAAKEEGAAIDGTNEASIKLRDSVREVEQSHRDSAQAIIENGGTLADAQVEWQKGRDAVIGMLEAKGLDNASAVAWADQQLGSASEVKGGIDAVYQAWLDLPENKETKYQVYMDGALAKLEEVRAKISQIPGYRSITLETITIGNRTIDSGANYQGGMYANGMKHFASGGFASGIYAGVMGGIRDRDRIFAEKDMGVPWETYISGRAQDRGRNIGIWQQTGQMLGVGGGGSAASVTPVVYVQNPFTGDYLLAQVSSVAGAQVSAYEASANRASRGGVRP